MTSTAPGASPNPSKPTNEQWAIATGAVNQPSHGSNSAAIVEDSGKPSEAETTGASTTEAPEAKQESAPIIKTTGIQEAVVSETQATSPTESHTAAPNASSSETVVSKATPNATLETSAQSESGRTETESATKTEIESRTQLVDTTGSESSNDNSASLSNNSAALSNGVSGETQSSTAQTPDAGVNIEVSITSESPTNNSSNQSPAAQDNAVQDNATSEAVAEDSAQDEDPTLDDSQVQETLLSKDDLTTAIQLESPEILRSGTLAQDAAELYQFSVEETGVFTATLSELSADADVQLIQDKNSNGQVDAGEIVAWEWEVGNKDESIRYFLQEGDYVLRVLEQDISPEPTKYSITTTFEAAETDNRAFSINVIYQQGSDQLNEQSQEAIGRAADYWEDIISHSSFDRPLELALGIYGTTNTETPFLAYAGPYSYLNTGETGVESSSDKLLPVVGVAVLNNVYIDEYNSDPDYLESVLRHEIGHVLGLGVIWDTRGNDLVDQDKGVYRADTYAGQSYGELLGTGEATEIPLDLESLTHWDEDVFDAELITPQAEGIGNPLPLSQLTISSLRDLGWHVNYGAADAFSLDNNVIV